MGAVKVISTPPTDSTFLSKRRSVFILKLFLGFDPNSFDPSKRSILVGSRNCRFPLSKFLVNATRRRMSTLGAFEMDFGIHAHAVNPFTGVGMDGDEYVRCSKCGHGGCDVRVSGCGCTLHAVSFVLSST